MIEAVLPDNMTKEQKKACANGELVFDSQEHKLELLKETIDLYKRVVDSHRKDKNYSLLMQFKLILHFLEEYRDILEQYDIDFVDEEQETK